MTPTAPAGVRRARQQPPWPDGDELAQVEDELAARPGLVTEGECTALLAALARAARGEALVLQAGDCAERFADAAPAAVDRRAEYLYSLADAMSTASGLPVVPLGRMAGQYAKPRSANSETRADGVRLPVYRGDAVNGPEAEPPARSCDPRRLLAAYDHAAAVLGRVRATWHGRPAGRRLYVSHEGLLCAYESPLERRGAGGVHASSAHSVWIGDRTRALDGWHVEWAAGLGNPVGVKLGPSVTPAEAVRLSRALNPAGVEGKLLFIVRLGAGPARRLLPGLVAEVARRGAPVVWLCDPLHGNTWRLRSGRKTRPMEAVRDEVSVFTRIVRAHRQWPAGLHLETTPEDVTECVSAQDHTPVPSLRVAFPRYTSACDPRLNPGQTADVLARFTQSL
ncbi:3-deoxy-7-phosphoheptulonate synthase [Streptomyces pini]|uniref:Phospho-2-dehydro-3-deoxyheptonate aldolase n=1 Tax=Streptomyces pini TaxID=1520580 RepID=A0A1I4CQK8_9ACTN|nr:3-deoxy-7-phosphoheptulonate synthase [Streptomyces pini]SFK82537.1 3-deoxy-D-arabinoheptulosonate-7-phosphate synthase [Streptomyces pini]